MNQDQKIMCANDECKKDITKRYQLIKSSFCVKCKEELGDEFKWKMKKVGRNDGPTIAKSEEDWNKIKKQKELRDI